MTTEIQLFKTPTGSKFRTIVRDGAYYFAGKDSAKALGYANSRKAVRDHVDEEDKREERIVTPRGGTQTLMFISESGLYSLILSSKLPEAKVFKRWVTSEVLPALRRQGSYSTTPAALPAPARPYVYAEASNGYFYVYRLHEHKIEPHAKFRTAEDAERYCTLMESHS